MQTSEYSKGLQQQRAWWSRKLGGLFGEVLAAAILLQQLRAGSWHDILGQAGGGGGHSKEDQLRVNEGLTYSVVQTIITKQKELKIIWLVF